MVKNLPVNAGDTGNMGSIPGPGRFPGVGPWSRKWQLTPFFCGESHGQRGLVGYSPLGCKELDTTEWFHANVQGTRFQMWQLWILCAVSQT